MKKDYKLILTAALIMSAVFQLAAQVNGTAAKPLVSTVDKPVYYYIESAANGTVVLSATVNNNLLGNLLYVPTYTTLPTNLKYDLKANITTTDNALWQMVNEGGVVKLKNKGTGLVMVDSRNGNTTNTNNFLAEALNTQYTANSQYRLRNSNQTSPGVAWYSTANGNYLDRWGSTAPNSQVAWFFIVAPGSETNYEELLVPGVKADLAAKITATQAVLTNTSEGTNIGQFSAGARTTLNNAITTAQGVYDNSSSTSANYITSIANLETAKWAYISNAVTPVISNESTTKWYLIQGTRPTNPSYLTSMGVGAFTKSLPLVPDDTQYWKFVANTNGTADGFSLVNKATGEYLNSDTLTGGLRTVTAMPVKNLRNIVSDIFTNGTARFWIENTGSPVTFRMHAGNTGVINWFGNAYDNSSWLIVEYITLLKSTLQTAITNAQSLLDNSVDGTDFGQYPGTGRGALSAAITTAQAAHADGTKSEQEVIDATTALNTAMTDYKATCNTNVNSLLSTTQGMYRWYWIRSTASHAYAVGKVISQGTRAIGEKYTFEAKATTPTPSKLQIFRFELTDDKTKVANIVDGLGHVMAENGAIATTPTAGNEFALNLLSDGISFNIKPTSVAAIHAQEAGSHIVNWAGDAGSASAWVFDYAMETPSVPTGFANQTKPFEKIRIKNGIVNVDGVDNFELFSVTGQRHSIHTPLKSGVYVVKIQDYSQKVIVK